MKNLITTSLCTTMLYSLYANAAIDVKAAYSDALELVAVKFLIAAIAFYILSFGLINKPKDTAAKNGRWYGALIASISIISATTLYKTDADLYYGSAIMTVVWFGIGYFIGYVWFKLKKVKDVRADTNNVKPNSDTKVLLIISVLVGLSVIYGLFVFNGFEFNSKAKTAIYEVFPSCKTDGKDCTKAVMTMTFKVDKDRSQVVAVITTLFDNETSMKKLDNCIVIDEHNWQCTDKSSTQNFGYGNWIIDDPYKYIMVNDNMTMSDSVYTSSTNNKVETKTYYGFVFVKK